MLFHIHLGVEFDAQVGEDRNPKRDNNEYMVLFFVMFMLFGSFFLVNLFVGIIMDNFASKRQELGTRHLFLTNRQVCAKGINFCRPLT